MGDADERGDAVAAHRARHDDRDGDLGELVGARLREPATRPAQATIAAWARAVSATAGARAGAAGGAAAGAPICGA